MPSAENAWIIACYDGKSIDPKVHLSIAMLSGGWTTLSAPFIIVDDQKQISSGETFYQKLASNS